MKLSQTEQTWKGKSLAKIFDNAHISENTKKCEIFLAQSVLYSKWYFQEMCFIEKKNVTSFVRDRAHKKRISDYEGESSADG